MDLKDYSTITSEQIHCLAYTLACRHLPVIERFEPIADFEELVTFVTQHPTPIVHTERNPIWRLESVAARLIEAVTIATHEPIEDTGWKVLAQTILEHAEYLYTYHNPPHARERLQSGAVLALMGSVCHELPQSAAWRLAGFSRMAEAFDAAEEPSTPHLIAPIDAAFDLAVALELPILGEAIDLYNVKLHRDLRWEKRTQFRLSDPDFFDDLDFDKLNPPDLNCPGLESVKSEWANGNLERAKSAYAAFLRQKMPLPLVPLPSWVWDEEGNAIDFDRAKSYLERVRYLSAHQVHELHETCEIGIGALRFPEWRNREQLLKLALRRYKWMNDTYFFPDGFHTDCAITSHHLAFTGISSFYRLAKLTHPHLLQDFDEQFEKQTDLILISDDGFATMLSSPSGRGPGGEGNLPDVEFTGEYLFLRFDAQGEPHWAAMINGQFLKVNGRVLANLPEPRACDAISYDN